MSLDPDTARFLDEFGALVPTPPPLDSEEATASFLEGLGSAGTSNLLEGDGEPVADVYDVALFGQRGVSARVYRPEGNELPVVVFFHGGVFVLGDLDMHDPGLRALAKAIPAVIVSVGYRLAPAHPFPAAVDDCFGALKWAAENTPSLGGSNQLVVMGDSAGGALAAVVAAQARDEGGPPIALQVLVYPMVDPSLTTRSAEEFAEGYLTTTAFLRLGWKVYLAGQEGRPYSAPAVVDDLGGLPPAVVITAGYDPLRDEGQGYAMRLSAAGVEVMSRHYPGQIHGFAFMAGVIPKAKEALAEIAELVSEGLNRTWHD